MPRPPRWRFPLTAWEIATTLSSVVLLVLIVARCIEESGGSSKERRNRVRCPARLKQIGRALAAYAQDHNGALPPGLDALIAHDLVKPDLFVCPSSADECAVGTTREEILADFAKPGRCSYLYFGAGLHRPSPTAVIACDHPMNLPQIKTGRRRRLVGGRKTCWQSRPVDREADNRLCLSYARAGKPL